MHGYVPKEKEIKLDNALSRSPAVAIIGPLLNWEDLNLFNLILL